MRFRREHLLRYCTGCNVTTNQVRIHGGETWRCTRCNAELHATNAELIRAAEERARDRNAER